MYSYGQKCKAIDTYFRFDRSIADTVAELGCPSRHTPYLRVQDCEKRGEVRRCKQVRDPECTGEEKRSAVGYCLSHGKSPAGTMGATGYPGGKEHLCKVARLSRHGPGLRKKTRHAPPYAADGSAPMPEQCRSAGVP